MKKGFTLIELLAVIVILAIIALIATPIVLNIINDTKESATLRSADFYVDALENEIMLENMKQGGSFNPSVCIVTNGTVSCDGKPIDIKVDGEKPSNGSKITFEDGKVTSVNLIYASGTVTLNNKGELVLGESIQEESEEVLAPGLYDENDNLKISWADLTSIDYQSITFEFWNEELEDFETVTSSILTVDENGVLTAGFDDMTAENYSAEYLVGKLVIDESVTSIGIDAFRNCSNLTGVEIPNSVISIGHIAFGSTGLTSLIIPDSVTSIGNGIIAGSINLTSIKVDENNSVYDSRDNCNAIIETATNTLKAGINNTIIPNGITAINYLAFTANKITSIIIPDSVIKIGSQAFFYCPNLNVINYRGTEEEWNTIEKEINWNWIPSSNIVINYNYVG